MKNNSLLKKIFFNLSTLVILVNLFLVACETGTSFDNGLNEDLFTPRNNIMVPCYGDYNIQSQYDLDNLKNRGCTEITGNLNVRYSSLQSLIGLESLNSIRGNVSINNNNSLKNLYGLNNVNFIGGDVLVISNSKLPTCEARKFVDKLKENNWSGNSIIQDNDDYGNCGNDTTVDINAYPTIINQGESSTLYWTSENATYFSINNRIGTVYGNSHVVTPSETTTYTITANGPGGIATDSVTVIVKRVDELPTVKLTASPTVINPGGNSYLSWTATNYTDIRCYENGNYSNWCQTGTAVTVSPSQTTTYTITASGPGGTASDSVTVTVDPGSSLFRVYVNPQVINQGESSVLSWTPSNAAIIDIDNGIGSVYGNSGSVVLTPSKTTTYKVRASLSGQIVTDSVTVTVIPIGFDPPTVNINAHPTVIEKGECSVLFWSSQNATDHTIVESIDAGINSGASPGVNPIPNKTYPVVNNSIEVCPTVTTTYTITASGPGGTKTDSVTITVNSIFPPTVNIYAQPSMINQGQSSVLTWTSTNATSFWIDNGVGPVYGNSGTVTVTPSVDTTYTITANGAGGTVTASVPVKVIPIVPPTVSISANPTVITQGGSSVLTWTSFNATSIWIDNGVGSVSGNSGTVTVTPSVNTTYTITASGPGGTAIDSVIVEVNRFELDASPMVINQGESSDLQWPSVTDATNYWIDNGVGPVFGNSIEVSPTVTTTYTITVSGPGVFVSDSVTITVVPVGFEPPSVNISAHPLEIKQGECAVLFWSSQNATDHTIIESVNSGINTGTKTLLEKRDLKNNSIQVCPTVTTTYTITASGPGGTATDSVTVVVHQVPGVPTAGINVSPSVINAGESSILTWTSDNATTVKVEQNGVFISSAHFGSKTVSPTVTTTYTITASGPGGTATDSVTVIVNQVPGGPTVSLNASSSEINAGESVYLIWESANATTVKVEGNGGTISSTHFGSIEVNPTVTTTYTITAIGTGGTATDSVTVIVKRPNLVTVNISAYPAQIKAGESTTLTWNSTNATKFLIDQGVGEVTGKLITVNPTVTTKYTITAIGPDGFAVDSVTVIVTSTIDPTVNMSANPIVINQGESSLLSWTSTNATYHSIDNGIGPVFGNSRVVTPTVTTTYTITANGSTGGVATARATVIVRPSNKPTVNISATPSVINNGDMTRLSWISTGATELILHNNHGRVTDVTGTSYVLRTPTETTFFTITASGPGGSATDSIRVIVNRIEKPTVRISANPSTIKNGKISTISWTSTNATELILRNNRGRVTDVTGTNSVRRNPRETTVFTITAKGPGGTATDKVKLYVRRSSGYSARSTSTYSPILEPEVESTTEAIQPLAHWTFEEGQGNIVSDAFGNNYSGTIIGNAEWVDGVVGKYALDISEDSGYVEVVSLDSDNGFYQERFTVSTWLTSANDVKEATCLGLPGSWQVITEDNELKFVYYNADGEMIKIESGYTFPESEEWHHYAITVDIPAGEILFYVDGVELNKTDQIDFIIKPVENQLLLIGQNGDEYRWNGLIDDVRFYDTVLNSTEIYNLLQKKQ